MSRARWWRPLAPPLLALAVLMTGSAASAMAAYPASIDVNTTAFNPPCDGDANAIVPKMHGRGQGRLRPPRPRRGATYTGAQLHACRDAEAGPRTTGATTSTATATTT